MTSTNTFQGINPADSKTTSKVLAPPGGKTSISLFGGEQSEPSPQPSQRGSRHPDRNASSVVFQSADQQAAKSGAAAKPGHDSANNLFGPPPARNSPKPKAPQDSHNAIFGKADPASTKPVQTSKNTPSLPNGPIISAEPDEKNSHYQATTPGREKGPESPTHRDKPAGLKKSDPQPDINGVKACLYPTEPAEPEVFSSPRMTQSLYLPGSPRHEETLPNPKRSHKRIIPKAAGRNPISGSTDIENQPPCGQHHKRHAGRATDSNPILGSGEDLKTYDITRESKARTPRPKSEIVTQSCIY